MRMAWLAPSAGRGSGPSARSFVWRGPRGDSGGFVSSEFDLDQPDGPVPPDGRPPYAHPGAMSFLRLEHGATTGLSLWQFDPNRNCAWQHRTCVAAGFSPRRRRRRLDRPMKAGEMAMRLGGFGVAANSISGPACSCPASSCLRSSLRRQGAFVQDWPPIEARAPVKALASPAVWRIAESKNQFPAFVVSRVALWTTAAGPSAVLRAMSMRPRKSPGRGKEPPAA